MCFSFVLLDSKTRLTEPSMSELVMINMKYFYNFEDQYLCKLCMKMNRNGTIKLVLLFQVGLPCAGLELMAFSPNKLPKVNPCLYADWSPSWNNNGRSRLSSRSMSDTQRDACNDKYFTISA